MKSVIDFSNPWNPKGERLRHQFGLPLYTLVAHQLADVPKLLQEVQKAAEQGQWCVGWLAYEAATALDAMYEGAVHEALPGQPLVWFGVHAAPTNEESTAEPFAKPVAAQSASIAEGDLVQWQSNERPDFEQNIERIHAAIAAGECYQINYTAPIQGKLCRPKNASKSLKPEEQADALFARLQQAQPGGYAAMIDGGGMQVLSVSPELFFDWDGEQILTRPMKGTAARGKTPEEDAQQVQIMRESAKERAENVMIVDLLRNDLSRIAVAHSVKVPHLFNVEALPSVWQMTSDVQATTRPEVQLLDVFRALFPCGSITGAPKRQAMRLIHALEPQARGVYCGALGVVRPGKVAGRIHATFNVPIRTVVLQGDAVCCGIGSGITSSASAPAEWQEWNNKKIFLESLGSFPAGNA